uniref:Rib_recp_KP_reg domain-containing protein n=1 Tax=Caenorhabditis tropicalis TaxID=1561998 RepID=A0A1I7V300_9PELO
MHFGAYSDTVFESLNEVWLKMVDPYVAFTGLFAAVITVVLFYFVYWNNKDEGDFEKVYTKERASIVFNADKKINPKETAKGNKNQKKKQKSPDATEDEQEKVDKREVSSPPPANQRTIPSQEAPKLKTAPKQQQQVELTPPKEQAQKESPKPAKKKPVKVINASDVDQKMLMSRLSNVSDLEEGFVQYLHNLYRDHEKQKNNLINENKSLQNKLSDMKGAAERAEQREKKEANIRANVVKQSELVQSDLRSKLQEANNIVAQRSKDFESSLQKLQSKNQQLESEISTNKSNYSKLVSQLKNSQQQTRDEQHKLAQLKKTHAQDTAKVEAEKAETEANVVSLKAAVDETMRRLDELNDVREQMNKLKKENADLTESVNASRLALDNQTKRDEEGEKELSHLREEKETWIKEKEEMQERYTRLDALMKELNNDISEFHSYKDSQEKIVGELNHRVADLTAEKEVFTAREAELVKQVTQAQNQLADIKEKVEQERSRIVEIPKNSPEPQSSVEEVFELKKTQTNLAAAPSTSEVNAVNKKIEELRERNLILLEKAEAIPEQLINERKRVVAELEGLSEKSFDAFDDENAYTNWVNKTVTSIKTSLATPKATSSEVSPAVTSSSEHKKPRLQLCVPKPNKLHPQLPKANPSSFIQDDSKKNEIVASIPSEAVCYKALQSVANQLDNISILFEKEKRCYEEEIALLKSQIH